MKKRSTPSTQGVVIVPISPPWICWLRGGISIAHLLSTHMINVVHSLDENDWKMNEHMWTALPNGRNVP